jgi:hypothetical protein
MEHAHAAEILRWCTDHTVRMEIIPFLRGVCDLSPLVECEGGETKYDDDRTRIGHRVL